MGGSPAGGAAGDDSPTARALSFLSPTGAGDAQTPEPAQHMMYTPMSVEMNAGVSDSLTPGFMQEVRTGLAAFFHVSRSSNVVCNALNEVEYHDSCLYCSAQH